MSKMEEARTFLRNIGMPKKQLSDICCLSLLAMAGVSEDEDWDNAENGWLRIHDIIAFANKYYDRVYAENSRETFRKQAMHHFRNAALIEDNGLATNSPNYRYRITEETLDAIRKIGSEDYDSYVELFISKHQKLTEKYESKKQMAMMPVKINMSDFTFSPGKHNELQKAILEVFAPRYAPHSECLYVGDTIEKDLVKNVDKLQELGFEITLHDKMPDVVLYSDDVNKLYFVEAVTSVGPMDSKRVLEISEMTCNVSSDIELWTAFLNRDAMKPFLTSIAWETFAWVADEPEHKIHFDGDLTPIK